LPSSDKANVDGQIRTPKSVSREAPGRRIGSQVWNYERLYEVSMRCFAKQHPRRIAEEMGSSYAAVQTILWRLCVPRGYHKTEFVDEYDPVRGEANMQASGYEFVPSKGVPRKTSRACKEWFWRHKVKERWVHQSPLDRRRLNRLDQGPNAVAW
jgi:hypothetical protein